MTNINSTNIQSAVNLSLTNNIISGEIELDTKEKNKNIVQLDNLVSTTSKVDKVSSNNSILFVGMNPKYKLELNVLKNASKKHNFQVENISETKNWSIDDFDLKSEAGISNFIESLELENKNQKQALKKLLLDINSEITQSASGRDEIAAIIQVWSRAEKGGEIPSRLVISGHGNSISIWGDKDKGQITISDIKLLAQIMPKASAQVQDIMISACRCAYKDIIEGLKNSFPSLNTIWGYAGTAPLAENGGVKHFEEWELKTRGDNSNIDREKELKVLSKTSQFQNIAIWSHKNGYQRRKMDTSEGFVELVLRTEKYRIGDFNSNDIKDELNELYDQMQDLKSVSETGYKEACEIYIEKINILRHFPETVSKFDQVLGPTIKDAFKIAKLECPELEPTDKNKFIAQFIKKSEVLLNDNKNGKFNNLPKEQKELVNKVANLIEHIILLDTYFIRQDWLTSDLTEDIKKDILKIYNETN